MIDLIAFEWPNKVANCIKVAEHVMSGQPSHLQHLAECMTCLDRLNLLFVRQSGVEADPRFLSSFPGALSANSNTIRVIGNNPDRVVELVREVARGRLADIHAGQDLLNQAMQHLQSRGGNDGCDPAC